MIPSSDILFVDFFSDLLPSVDVSTVVETASASTVQNSTLPGSDGLEKFIFRRRSSADNSVTKTADRIITEKGKKK
jgi:hypothetical protein